MSINIKHTYMDMQYTTEKTNIKQFKRNGGLKAASIYTDMYMDIIIIIIPRVLKIIIMIIMTTYKAL